jgi:hypothetical protein
MKIGDSWKAVGSKSNDGVGREKFQLKRLAFLVGTEPDDADLLVALMMSRRFGVVGSAWPGLCGLVEQLGPRLSFKA